MEIELNLDPVEARVLGCLAEKDMTTPDYYPLSLNALVNACNQKSNRDPVVSFDDSTAREALASLRDRGLAAFISDGGSRVEKFRHRLWDQFNFSRGEMALLTVLLLRGPQTPGELRQRAERMHAFEDLDTIQHVLGKLAARQPQPLVRLLGRTAGTKEARWAHLFCGEAGLELPEAPPVPRPTPLEDRLAQLEEELTRLRAEFERFRNQFS